MPIQQPLNQKPMTNRFKTGLQLTLLSLLVSSSAFAQQNLLSLNEALQLTLAGHPQLKSFAHQAQAAQRLVEQAAVATPLSLDFDVEDAMGTGTYSGISSMQSTVGISWLLEDKVIDARVKVASEQATVSDFSREIKALDLAAQTASVFVTLLSQKERLKLAKLAELQGQKALKAITTRVKAAKTHIVDQLRAKAALSKQTLEVEDLVHEVEASRAELAAQWQGEMNFQASGTLIGIPSIEALNNAYEKLKTNPRLKLFATQQRIAQSQIELAKADANPAWKISTGVRRNERVDDFAFTAGLSIPFGSENRNQGKILALQAQQQEQQALADAWYKRISTQLLLLTHKLKHNRHVIETLTAQTIPTLNEATEKAAEAYRIGNYSYTEWYAVQQELLTAQSELIAAYTSIHLNNIELERLTGASISN